MKDVKNILKNIRLKKEEIETIRNAIKKHDENAKVYLFGSRTQKDKRGGDIDLLIISEKIDFNKKLKILTELYLKLGEQKFDLIICKKPDETPFTNSVFENSINL